MHGAALLKGKRPFSLPCSLRPVIHIIVHSSSIQNLASNIMRFGEQSLVLIKYFPFINQSSLIRLMIATD